MFVGSAAHEPSAPGTLWARRVHPSTLSTPPSSKGAGNMVLSFILIQNRQYVHAPASSVTNEERTRLIARNAQGEDAVGKVVCAV